MTPFTLHSRKEGGLSTDIGAEKVILAENGLTKIAVEVKSFIHMSILHEFLKASGQYMSYSNREIITRNNLCTILDTHSLSYRVQMTNYSFKRAPILRLPI